MDGRLGKTTGESDYCAEVQAPSGGYAWWKVDLLSPHVIHNVTLFNRYDQEGASCLILGHYLHRLLQLHLQAMY